MSIICIVLVKSYLKLIKIIKKYLEKKLSESTTFLKKKGVGLGRYDHDHNSMVFSKPSLKLVYNIFIDQTISLPENINRIYIRKYKLNLHQEIHQWNIYMLHSLAACELLFDNFYLFQ